MTAAPDSDDLDELVERIRPQLTDVETAHQLLALLDELRERRRAQTPNQAAKFERLRLAKQEDAALAAKGIARAERVKRLEDKGYSRTIAYQIARPDISGQVVEARVPLSAAPERED